MTASIHNINVMSSIRIRVGWAILDQGWDWTRVGLTRVGWDGPGWDGPGWDGTGWGTATKAADKITYTQM